MSFMQILAIIGAILVVAMVAEAWIKRNRPKRSFAEKFKPGYDEIDGEEKPELGMEATDMNSILISERGNRSAASLGARDFGFWTADAKRKRRAAERPIETPQKEETND